MILTVEQLRSDLRAVRQEEQRFIKAHPVTGARLQHALGALDAILILLNQQEGSNPLSAAGLALTTRNIISVYHGGILYATPQDERTVEAKS